MNAKLKARFSEAVHLKEDGNLASAKEILVELSEKDDESAAILATLGHVCWDLKLLDEAVVAFKRAVALRPDLEAVSLGLFHCLWELEKREAALDEIKRFQSISDSANYREIIREINVKCKSATTALIANEFKTNVTPRN